MTDAAPSAVAFLLEERPSDARALRIAAVAAVLVHAALFAVTWPEIATRPAASEPIVIRVMELTHVLPPPPPAELPALPTVRRVPVPDPTPLDPEPVRLPETEPVEMPDFGDLVLAIPTDIPPPVAEEPTTDTGIVGVHLAPPRALFKPDPAYPEIARRAKVQGPVELELLIDESGAVADVTVVRGLRLGCTEAALEAARRWRFEPSTLGGRPVKVIYRLTVHFRLS